MPDSDITAEKLRRFVKIRNASAFNSNLQFQADADEAGFSSTDLPEPTKPKIGLYVWKFPFGLLVERNGVLDFTEQNGTKDEETRNRAREIWASDDLEIDEDAEVHEAGDSGRWVAAWVYVPNEDDED